MTLTNKQFTNKHHSVDKIYYFVVFIMPTGYSLDLRTKIVAALENGSPQRNVAKRFSVSLSTVKRYWKLHKDKEDLSPKKPTKTRPNKVNWSEVLEFVKSNKDRTLREIGQNFKVSAFSIFYILKMSNFTFKKSRFYTKKETKTSAKNSLKKLVKSKINR